jgi:hypothetical protein
MPDVCSCQKILRRNGRDQTRLDWDAPAVAAAADTEGTELLAAGQPPASGGLNDAPCSPLTRHGASIKQPCDGAGLRVAELPAHLAERTRIGKVCWSIPPEICLCHACSR